MLIINSFMLAFLLANLMNSLASMLSSKKIEDQEKSSPFECGFDPMKSSRQPFSMRFFMIAIIFLVFDVEITLILPAISNLYKSNFNSWSITTTIFIVTLIAGLMHEWNQGILDWIK